MTIRVVQLGSPRHPQEGTRIGTVRRPPRGVPKEAFASGDWYDVWFPNLAPSAELVKQAQAAQSAAEWQTFERAYRAEMKAPEQSRELDLLAALSHGSHFSIGCYCQDEAHCHRSVLRALLRERGAALVE
ncbi:DUF488 domain-containing protein [Chromobacterium rhizoryzae]|uniref:DUF488 domain-containing protein n=1 Tax=Chromobacterium rhizoryzae TaxID=1778675 RepID=UPI001D0632CC|nr:DUF488 family protein [Chromobacterium rhizoryzae]